MLALLLWRLEILKSHSRLRRQLDEIIQGLADIAFTISTVGQAFGNAAFADLTGFAVKKFDAIRFAAITLDLFGQDFGFVHLGPFSSGGFPFDVAVFPALPGMHHIGTIQTAKGNHIHSSVGPWPNRSRIFHLRFDTKERRGSLAAIYSCPSINVTVDTASFQFGKGPFMDGNWQRLTVFNYK